MKITRLNITLVHIHNGFVFLNSIICSPKQCEGATKQTYECSNAAKVQKSFPRCFQTKRKYTKSKVTRLCQNLRPLVRGQTPNRMLMGENKWFFSFSFICMQFGSCEVRRLTRALQIFTFIKLTKVGLFTSRILILYLWITTAVLIHDTNLLDPIICADV